MLKKHSKEIIIGLITGLLNGFFGAGGGSVVVPATEVFLGFEAKKAHATAVAIILMLSIVSSAFYVKNGFFDLKLWLLVSIGGLVGGYVGARFLGKLPKRLLKLIFGAAIIFTAVKMIF